MTTAIVTWVLWVVPPLGITADEDWSRFRGPNGTGVSQTTGLPTEFGPEKNLAWKVDSGAGSSSPIIANGRLIFTSFADQERLVHCLDPATGQVLWQQSFRKERDEVATEPCGPATPTPVSDGRNVYVFFPDVGLICCSYAGEIIWKVQLEAFHSFHGIASSLVLVEGNVLVLADQLKDSYLAAYNCANGDLVWKANRRNGAVGGYSTPSTCTTPDGTVQVVVPGPLELVGYDARSGERKWWVNGITNAPVSVPVVAKDRLFVCEPYYEANPFKIEDLAQYDKNQDGKVSRSELGTDVQLNRLAERIDDSWGNGDGEIEAAELETAFGTYVKSGGLVAVNLGGSQDVTGTHVRWSYQKTVPQVASVLLYENILYFANDSGILTALDPDRGAIIKRGRLGNSGRKYNASPVAADGKLYFLDTDGKLAVVKAGKEWDLLATNDLGQPCHATPAIANGRIFVRTERSLFCFAQR
jgi:outer membrane protein assembly factor BamB